MDYQHLSVEEGLRMIAEKAGMLRFVHESLAAEGSLPEPRIFNGLSDICSEIEQLADCAKRSLDTSSLCRQLGRSTKPP